LGEAFFYLVFFGNLENYVYEPTLDVTKDVILMIIPLLLIANRNMAFLLSAFNASSTRLYDGNPLGAVLICVLTDDELDGHDTNSFADNPTNALLPSLLE
jgi:hypothetical protein